MTGADGSILKRPDSEEPIEHDGMSHFFAATLADVDPFVGWRPHNPSDCWPGWKSVGPFNDCTRIKPSRQCVPEESKLGDNLVLWPSLAEIEADCIDDGVPMRPGERHWMESVIEGMR